MTILTCTETVNAFLFLNPDGSTHCQFETPFEKEHEPELARQWLEATANTLYGYAGWQWAKPQNLSIDCSSLTAFGQLEQPL